MRAENDAADDRTGNADADSGDFVPAPHLADDAGDVTENVGSDVAFIGFDPPAFRQLVAVKFADFDIGPANIDSKYALHMLFLRIFSYLRE